MAYENGCAIGCDSGLGAMRRKARGTKVGESITIRNDSGDQLAVFVFRVVSTRHRGHPYTEMELRTTEILASGTSVTVGGLPFNRAGYHVLGVTATAGLRRAQAIPRTPARVVLR